MKYSCISGHGGGYPVKTEYFFFLFLIACFFSGCAVSDKAPRDDGFLLERARLIRESGRLAYTEGDYQSSLLSFREALVIDRQIKDKSGEISDLTGMGRACTGLDRPELAQKYLTEAVKKAFSSRDDKGLAWAYSALAESYLRGGYFNLAMQNVNDAISLTRSGGRESIEMLNLAASIYLAAGRLDEASAMAESAMKAQTSIFPSPSAALAVTYRLKAGILSKKGDIDSALRYYDMAFSVHERLGHEKNMALDLWSAAVVLVAAQRYGEAINRLKESYLLYRKIVFPEGAVKDIDKLVEVYAALGDKKSESYYLNMREALLADMR